MMRKVVFVNRFYYPDLSATSQMLTDLAVRLTYAEVEHQIVPDPLLAIDALPQGPVEVIANYTAFRDLNARSAGE